LSEKSDKKRRNQGKDLVSYRHKWKKKTLSRALSRGKEGIIEGRGKKKSEGNHDYRWESGRGRRYREMTIRMNILGEIP